MSQHRHLATLDGNEAVANIAHLTSEVIAIYPITPSSPMGEFSDHWSAHGIKNLWGTVPAVVEMQSEGGAAGVVHGALQAGSLCTTFTASQGLLLMIPNMYKIAGELSPFVMHVAARALAAQGLSIFGDHGDVMAARSTGFAMVASNSVQESHDMALITQSATLESRLPILHFFDGFRTSHEVAKIELVSHENVRQMINDDAVAAHRARALTPDRPVIRGTSQNPDVYFQGRETVNAYYQRFPMVLQGAMDRFARLTGREYRLYQYVGHPEAERAVVIMGSGAETVEETVDHLVARGEKIGMLKVRMFRPFAADMLLAALPETVKKIAVLDRCKEPGADGEPLYKDVLGAVAHAVMTGTLARTPRVVGGRYGLASKEFTPGMVKAVFEELSKDNPKNGFTVGIVDDVTHTSLDWSPRFATDASAGVTRAMFFGLGSDGTVSANKNTIKIMGEETELYPQGYFVYDSKKAGAVTISHLRFSPKPIKSEYLIGENEANFVACHQTVFLEKYDMLSYAAEGGVFLLNSPVSADEVWDTLPRSAQQQIIDKRIRFYSIDAYAVAKQSNMGSRINTIMQTCFFAISGILPREAAIESIKGAVLKTYGKKGKDVVEQNYRAIDNTLANLHEIGVPSQISSQLEIVEAIPSQAPEFVRRVLGEILAGRGDGVPVSWLPDDGTYPVSTSQWDKRNIALEIPVWDAELCIFCGKCPFVCPHSAIRSKVFDPADAVNAPESFKHVPVKGKDFGAGMHISYQVAPEDCTGCGLCVDICPAVSKTDPNHRALDMAPQPPLRQQEKENWEYFLDLPEFEREKLNTNVMKSAMVLQPLFEFASACVGCGETPYIRLASQLFGDRMLIANSTGCSSIYGGNLPTTPYTVNAEGRGPAWSNSLFEDNAEFGLGFRVSVDKHSEYARELVALLRDEVGAELADGILGADQSTEAGINAQRRRVEDLRARLATIDKPQARELETVADYLSKKSVWIIGGDGWAYDIGFGGVDHVLASGYDVNILVLDTEVYSNTGGQACKATPKGATAKFAAGGKASVKKDLAQIAMSYGDVYVATVAFGAKDIHTLRAFHEAESYPGVSLIIAYSPCVEHGIDLSRCISQQSLAVNSGHWSLLRYDPRRTAEGLNPLQLDSKKPSIAYQDFLSTERRFHGATKVHPELKDIMQASVNDRYQRYQQMADDLEPSK